jgi:hypothetical protein
MKIRDVSLCHSLVSFIVIDYVLVLFSFIFRLYYTICLKAGGGCLSPVSGLRSDAVVLPGSGLRCQGRGFGMDRRAAFCSFVSNPIHWKSIAFML